MSNNVNYVRIIEIACLLLGMSLVATIVMPSKALAEEYLNKDTFIEYVRTENYDTAYAVFLADSLGIGTSMDTELIGACAYLFYTRNAIDSACELMRLVHLWDNNYSIDYLSLCAAHKFLGNYYLTHPVYVRGRGVEAKKANREFKLAYSLDTTASVLNGLALSYSNMAIEETNSQLMDSAVTYGLMALTQSETAGASWLLHHNQGGYYEYLRLYDSGVEQYRTALALEPAAVEVYYELATLYRNVGNDSDAIATLKSLIDIQNDTEVDSKRYMRAIKLGYFQLSCCYASNGNVQETIDVLEQAKKKDIRYPKQCFYSDNDYYGLLENATFKEYLEERY